MLALRKPVGIPQLGTPHWSNAPLDSADGWTNPQSVPAPGGRLVSQTINPIKIVAALAAKSDKRAQAGHLRL